MTVFSVRASTKKGSAMQPTATNPTADQTIVIRAARQHDEPALLRLAALDSAAHLHGEILVADVDGEILAALAVAGGRTIADPFRRTADLVELLRTRARLMGLAGDASRRGRHTLRRPATVALVP